MAGFWPAATHINKTDSTTLNKSAKHLCTQKKKKTERKRLCKLNKEDHEKSGKGYTADKRPGRNCALQLVESSDAGSANVATKTSYLAVEKFNAAPLFQWPVLSRSQAARGVIPNRRADHGQIPEPPWHRQQQQEASPSSKARSCRKSPAFLAQGAHTHLGSEVERESRSQRSAAPLVSFELSLAHNLCLTPLLATRAVDYRFRSGCPLTP